MNGSDSVNWFIGTAFVALLAWLIGVTLGRRSPLSGYVAIALGVVFMLAWGWLIRNPATAVAVIPVGVLSRLEGVGGVPFFMLILGAAWARSNAPRQRALIGWAMMFGAIYFVNGGMWMLQRTPTAVMGQSIVPHEIRQSQDYSCVPAACATALNLIGVPTTEMQMADLTQTRPGTGATMIRALDGLNKRLKAAPFRPELREPSLEELTDIPLPMLTPLQFETTRRHMVVLTRFTSNGVWVLDPMDGYAFYSFADLRPFYRNQVITFRNADR
ncbi:MAG: cysteine peptidase family C39 domain-containing protein [Planctomycetota bacterium]